MSYTGYHHICNQWYRNGTYYNSDSCSIQLNDLSSEKLYSGQSAYACIYRSCCFLCNSCTASLQGFIPSLYDSLGIYIPLIVVNCIILGRAEAYASKNKPIASLFDGIGMGLGFTLSITCIGAVRELIGAGSLFGHQVLPLADAAAGKAGYEPITIFILAPGAFFCSGSAFCITEQIQIGAAKRGIDPSNPDCGGSCAACGNTMCKGKRG